MLYEVIIFFELLELVEFKHIYRERNALADELAKASTTMRGGFWHITEHNFSEINESIMPF